MKPSIKIPKKVAVSILAIATGSIFYISPVEIRMAILATLTVFGMVIFVIVFMMLMSVFFKDAFAHDPNNPYKIAWMVKVAMNHSVVIQRGGRPMHVLRGDEGPIKSDALFGLWMWYKNYVMKITGYHVYVPFFTGPTVYDLPRYRVKEEDGQKVYLVVDESDPGYRSNHLRTEFTTWYFEYKGAEIQKVPFIIKGSVQITIPKGKEEDALYKTDSWNVLLDQALNSVIRAVVRRDMTLDMVIGRTSDSLRGKKVHSDDPYRIVAKLIMDHLAEYKISGMSLDEIVKIHRVDIIDFEDQLSEEERGKLRQAALGREEAYVISLKGDAEAEALKKAGYAEAAVIAQKGRATAQAQRLLVETHKENPELAEAIIDADARRAFAEKDGGILDAVAAAFLKGGKK